LIPYNYDNPAFAAQKDLLITDGTVTVNGMNYTVTGATVTITNELLESEAFELNQSLNSASQLTFGSCESSSVSFVIHDNIPTLKGKTLKVYLIPDSDASKMLQIGVYKVEEDKLSADRTKRQITAYDALYDILNADVAGWYNSLLPDSNSTVTLGQMRFALTAYFGLTQETISLPNDNLVIKRTIEPETLSGADVIKAICELEGCFGQISNEGKFKYVVLSENLDAGLFPSDTLYPANDLYPQDVNHDVDPISKAHYIGTPSFEDWNSESITGLTIRTDDADVGVTVGTNENVYVITGNFLVYGYNATQLTTAANNALSNMRNRYYKPCTVNAVGNPLHEVGDGIRISTTYRGIVTYILERKLSGIQALRDTYSANGEQYYNEQLNSVASQFKQLANKTTKIEKDVDGVKVYVDEQLDDTVQGSYAYVTAEEIGAKVSKETILTDLNSKLDSSSVRISSNRITCESTGSLVVDTTNFKLDASGNAKFSGIIEGATLKAGTSILAYDQYSSQYAAMASSGFALTDVSSGTNMIDAYAQNIYLREPGYGSTNFVWLYTDSVTHKSQLYLGGSGGHLSLQSNGSIGSSGAVAVSGTSFTFNGFNVLTENSQIPIPTTLKVEQIQNSSGNSRINIDYGSSAYNIVLNGSVNIGNGSSNDIRIKGRDVKWKAYSSLAAGDYVLVENQV